MGLPTLSPSPPSAITFAFRRHSLEVASHDISVNDMIFVLTMNVPQRLQTVSRRTATCARDISVSAETLVALLGSFKDFSGCSYKPHQSVFFSVH
jgi:hypothetical protein